MIQSEMSADSPTYLYENESKTNLCYITFTGGRECLFFCVFKRFIMVLLKTFIVQCYRVLSYESFIQLFYVESTGQ